MTSLVIVSNRIHMVIALKVKFFWKSNLFVKNSKIVAKIITACSLGSGIDNLKKTFFIIFKGINLFYFVFPIIQECSKYLKCYWW